MLKRIILLYVFFALALPAYAESIDSIIAKSGKGKSRPEYSICFTDIESGKVLYSYKRNSLLKPASNMKLVTTAAALDYLGDDFEYRTRYGFLGDDLAIIASGDPLSGDPVLAQKNNISIFSAFENVLKLLRQRNISEIKGNLIVDDFIFDDIRFHESWPIEQSNRWYEAQISGLNFNNNCVDILFKPNPNGGAAIYELMPDTRYLNIINDCKTISNGKAAVGATREYETNNVRLIGKCRIPLAVPIYVTVNRPSAYHGFVLAEFLQKNGISLSGTLEIKKVTNDDFSVPQGFDQLYADISKIETVLKQSNQRSLNMVAESLLKTIGAYASDHSSVASDKIKRSGSWANGRSAIIRFLSKVGIEGSQYNIDDGCGLSHDNRISADSMCKLLVYMYKSPYFETYLNSLATPQVGTLAKKRRFREFDGRIFAKTGYISGANTLSGYFKSQDGKWIAFSVLTNSPAASNSIIDKIVKCHLK